MPEPTFEQSLQRLEELIEALEEGNVPLADMVEKHEEANKLYQACQSQLRDAELRVERLNPKNGDWESAPVSDEETS